MMIFVLWQSNSILRYLANQYQGHLFYPTNPKQRASVDQWIDWQAIELNNSWSYLFMHIVRNSLQHQDPQHIDQSKKDWISNMQILEQQLKKTQAYVAGENFSIADIAIGLSVQRWYLTLFEKPDLPHIKILL